MTVVQQFKEIVDELTYLLARRPDEFVLSYDAESPPADIEFIYNPPEAARSDLDRKASSAARESAPVAPPRKLEANESCTLCSERIYPVKRFRVPGKSPVLVLHYNGPVQGSETLPDRSREFLFGSREQDDLFARMLKAVGWSVDDLFFQEYPACHFNAARSMPEDWNERCRNCLTHVIATLKSNGIRLLLLTGNSAVFLLSEEKARELAVSGKMLPLDFEGDVHVPALVIRSPAALLALEQKRLKMKNSLTDENRERYNKAVQEEKSIKQAVLDALKIAQKSLGI